jgi:hypothetical protein
MQQHIQSDSNDISVRNNNNLHSITNHINASNKSLTLNYQISNQQQKLSNLNDFIVMDKIGDGAYSNVFKVRRIED